MGQTQYLPDNLENHIGKTIKVAYDDNDGTSTREEKLHAVSNDFIWLQLNDGTEEAIAIKRIIRLVVRNNSEVTGYDP